MFRATRGHLVQPALQGLLEFKVLGVDQAPQVLLAPLVTPGTPAPQARLAGLELLAPQASSEPWAPAEVLEIPELQGHRVTRELLDTRVPRELRVPRGLWEQLEPLVSQVLLDTLAYKVLLDRKETLVRRTEFCFSRLHRYDFHFIEDDCRRHLGALTRIWFQLGSLNMSVL